MRTIGTLLLVAVLTACAAANKPVGSATGPRVAEAVASPDRFPAARVRWGGTIVSIENRNDSTWIEVIAFELTDEGRPGGTASEGRFFARIRGFLDPEVFTRGREFSVSGVLVAPVVRRIGEFEYRYPVVEVERYKLWPPRPVAREPVAPYFYDPWSPFRPWPYYRPYWPYWP